LTYEKAVEYVGSFINYERTTEWAYPEAFKLDRMRALAKEFGNPQNAYDSIIVAGNCRPGEGKPGSDRLFWYGLDYERCQAS
jgi:hypothetical protein